MGGHGSAALQLWLNFLGQLLPQLHSVREGWKRRMSHILETTQKQHRDSPATHPHWSKLLMSHMMP